jgi:endonuclease YncB( thermonuclease family)
MTLAIKVDFPRTQLGKARWISNTDGDTPTIQMTIRMLSIDAPELHFPGTTKPSGLDDELEGLLAGAGQNLSPGLRAYLEPRLKAEPGTRHERLAEQARKQFERLADTYLKPLKPKAKVRRPLYVTIGSDVFDRYQRLLAYIAPEEKDKAKRRTFNLRMLELGWAVNYLIYPNIPKAEDIELMRKAVIQARAGGVGMWKDQARLLLGYEYRYCARMLKEGAMGPDRHCVDVTTGKLVAEQDYHTIHPEDRLFIGKDDLSEAKKALAIS